MHDAILAGGQTRLKLQWMYNAATKRQISTAKSILKDICTEIIFMKYKEEIKVL